MYKTYDVCAAIMSICDVSHHFSGVVSKPCYSMQLLSRENHPYIYENVEHFLPHN